MTPEEQAFKFLVAYATTQANTLAAFCAVNNLLEDNKALAFHTRFGFITFSKELPCIGQQATVLMHNQN